MNDDGAVDHDYDEALVDFDEATAKELDQNERTFWPEERPEVAIDLVTRQPLLVRRKRASTIAEYWEETGFNLLTYKGHRYLPVAYDDTVWECVYIPDSPSKAHHDRQTYDFPDGRLMRIPLEKAWGGEGGDADE